MDGIKFMKHKGRTIDWLLAGDAAVRSQTYDYLQDAEKAEQARSEIIRMPQVQAMLAALVPKDNEAWKKYGWWIAISLGFSLLEIGLPATEPAFITAMQQVNETVRHFEGGQKPFLEGEIEACVNGRILRMASEMGIAQPTIADFLMADQLEDGGWNCPEWQSKHSSFHSTICALEGLRAYQSAFSAHGGIAESIARGEDYLLTRKLFRRKSDGSVVHPAFLQLAIPNFYHYDILRGLDYFRPYRNAEPAMQEALYMLADKAVDGRWHLEASHIDAELPIDFGEKVGEPSRRLTIKALRVLQWAGSEAAV